MSNPASRALGPAVHLPQPLAVALPPASVVRVILTLVGKTRVGIDRLFDPTGQLGSTLVDTTFGQVCRSRLLSGRPTASVNKFIE